MGAEHGDRSQRVGRLAGPAVPEVAPPLGRARRRHRAVVEVEGGEDPAGVERVGHGDAPGPSAVGSTSDGLPTDLQVAADRDAPVLEPGRLERARGPLGRPALHEPGGIEREGWFGTAGTERAAGHVIQPGARVEDVHDLGRSVERVALAAVDGADDAVGAVRAEDGLQPLELGQHRVDRGVDHVGRGVVVDDDAGHRPHRRRDSAHATPRAGRARRHRLSPRPRWPGATTGTPRR